MRETKYRAWEKATKRMLQVELLAFDGNGELSSVYTKGPDFSNDPIVLDGDVPDLENIVLEQYTGIKDIDGSPIFEGDIIKVTADDGSSYMAPIVWYGDEGYPAFDLDLHYIPKEWVYLANRLSSIVDTGEHAVVVGNIHENPELLEVPHD